MDCHAESVVSRGRKSNCFLVTGGILQASIVGPVLFTVGVPVFIPLSDLVSPDGPQTCLTALFQIMYLAMSPGWTLHLVHHSLCWKLTINLVSSNWVCPLCSDPVRWCQLVRTQTELGSSLASTLSSLIDQTCSCCLLTDRSLMNFNKRKCKLLHLAQNNGLQRQRLGAKWIESSITGKGLGVLMDKLDVSQLSALAAKKPN